MDISLGSPFPLPSFIFWENVGEEFLDVEFIPELLKRPTGKRQVGIPGTAIRFGADTHLTAIKQEQFLEEWMSPEQCLLDQVGHQDVLFVREADDSMISYQDNCIAPSNQ